MTNLTTQKIRDKLKGLASYVRIDGVMHNKGDLRRILELEEGLEGLIDAINCTPNFTHKGYDDYLEQIREESDKAERILKGQPTPPEQVK